MSGILFPVFSPLPSPLPFEPIPTTRRNRRPTSEERAGILAQIESDTVLLDVLKNQLATRCASRDQAASKVDAAMKNYEEAKFRLQTVRQTLQNLEESLKVLRGFSESAVPIINRLSHPSPSIISDTSKSTILPKILPKISESESFEIPSIISDTLEPATSPEIPSPQSFGVLQSIHITATNQPLQRHQKVTAVIQEEIEAVKKDLRNAHEAVSTTHENLQCAISLHTSVSGCISYIRYYIQGIDVVLATHHDRLRSIWYTPEDVWRHIFQLVVENDDEYAIQPISIQLLVLSSVCYTWRSILQSNSSLWALVPMHGWPSVDNIVIHSRQLRLEGLLRDISPLLTGLHTIELPGIAVDDWVFYLLDTPNHYAFSSQSIQTFLWGRYPSSILKSLRNLIVVDYDGNGEKILQLVEVRQALLHGIRWNRTSCIFKNNNAPVSEVGELLLGSDQPRLFVEYCFRNLGFGEPAVEIGLADSQHLFACLKYGEMPLMTVTSGDTQTATNFCFFRMAKTFQQHDPSLWQGFQRGEPAVPQILFKVQLRNCENIDPQVRQKLARYF